MTDSSNKYRRVDGSWDFFGVGRMVRQPAFRIGVVEGAASALQGGPGAPMSAEQAVDPDQLADVNDALAEAGLPPAKLAKADVGRGASAVGIIVEIGEAIAVFGGVTEVVIRTAQVVKAVHRKLSRRQGHAATVSLGAAEYLALADLVDRLGGAPIERVVGSGDVRHSSHDASFIGGDAFWVIVEAGGRLHHYQVDAFGRANYVGDAPLIPFHQDPPPPPPEDCRR